MKQRLLVVFCLLCMLMNLLVFSVCAASSGDCGDNATWSLSGDGVLTISGTGAIRNYIYEGANLWPDIKAPWRDNAAKVKKVVINSGITSIGDNAFCCLPNVTSVSIPNTVISIGRAAFCDMKALTEITIPESVKYKGENLFSGCSSLKEVNLPSGIGALSSGIFKGCSALRSIDLPEGVTSITGAFESSGLESLVIPEGITVIGTSTFQYCGNLTTVKLPSSLQYIGMQAFTSSGITSIVFPANVQKIGRSFVRCHKLKSIRFEGNAPEIDADAFDDVTATVYYPKENTTWTESVRKDYAGNLTWVSYCGNGHDWKPWQTERETTCAIAGLKTRSCTQCDMTEEELVARTAHQYEVTVTPPTCKKGGFTTHTCKVCKDTYKDSETPAGAHAFGEWVVIKESTCLEKGSRQHSCIACNAQETEETELSGHTYRDEVTAPSCTQEGFTTHICTVCEYTLVDTYTEITEHTCGEWIEIKSATWRKEGERQGRCVNCAEEYTEVIPKLPVNWGLIIGVIVVGVAVVGGCIVAIFIFKKKHDAK